VVVPDVSSSCKVYIRSVLHGNFRAAHYDLLGVGTGELCRALAVPICPVSEAVRA
jgi:hypothetical protein